MAKGDANKVQNQIDQQGGTAQNSVTNLATDNTNRTSNLNNYFTGAANQNQGNYNDVMKSYQEFLKNMPNTANAYSTFLGPKYAGASATGPATAKPVDESLYAPTGDPHMDAILQLYKKYGKTPGGPGSGFTDSNYWGKEALQHASGDSQYILDRLEKNLQGNGPDAPGPGDTGGNNGDPINSAIGGYQEFANTGGFSPEDIANIRARSVAPIHGIVDNARREISRSAAIRGTGYSPNTAAALAKSTRDAAYATGDIASNAEANIAQLKQQGRLYGLGGLSSTGLSSRNQDLTAIDSNARNNLSAIGGQTNLYGTTPGLTNMFGNQVLTSAGQGIQTGGLQNQLADMIMRNQLGKASVPGDFQSGMGNLASIFSLGGDIAKNFIPAVKAL